MPDSRNTSDELVDMFGRLPLHDLDSALARRLRERAHALLDRAHRPRRVLPTLLTVFSRVLEPALAGLLAAGNLAWAVLRSIELLP